MNRDVGPWMHSTCGPACGGSESEEVHSERTWPGRAHAHVLLRSLPGYAPRSDWVNRGVQVAGSVRVVHEGWDHGQHVTASDCRHDGLHRGSKRFFHPSPTKKHAD